MTKMQAQARVQELKDMRRNCSCKHKEQGKKKTSKGNSSVEHGEIAATKVGASVGVGSVTPVLVSSYSHTLAKSLDVITQVPERAEVDKDEKGRTGQTQDA